MIKLKEILNEAIKDDITDYQKDALYKIYGKDRVDKYIELDSYKTDVIKDAKIQLSEEDKHLIIDTFFDMDYKSIKKELNTFYTSIDNMFINALNNSIENKALHINIQNIWITDISMLFKPIFYNINLKFSNEQKQIVYSKNQRVNINKFIDSYNRLDFTSKKINGEVFKSSVLSAVNSLVQGGASQYAKMDDSENVKYQFDVDLFSNQPMYLYVTGNPSDILNMALSNFYDSCQNLYNGQYKKNILANVFDENMKVCYFIFNAPFVDKKGNEHPFTPLCRTILRNIKNKAYMDRTFPDRMQKIMLTIVNKYYDKEIKNVSKASGYKYTAMINFDKSRYDDTDSTPYFDKVETVERKISLKHLENYLNKYPEESSKVLNDYLQNWFEGSAEDKINYEIIDLLTSKGAKLKNNNQYLADAIGEYNTKLINKIYELYQQQFEGKDMKKLFAKTLKPATRNGNISIVKWLLSIYPKYFNEKQIQKMINEAIRKCAYDDKFSLLDYLIKKGGDINYKSPLYGNEKQQHSLVSLAKKIKNRKLLTHLKKLGLIKK